MIRLGVGSWTLPWAMGFKKNTIIYPRLTVFDLLDFADKYGISLVQLYNNMDILSFTKQELSDIKACADSHKIELAVGGDGIEPGHIHRLSQAAFVLGSKTVRIVIPSKEENAKYSINEVSSKLKEAVRDIDGMNLRLLIENHDRYSSEEYKRIIESVGTDTIGICFDTANSIGQLENYRNSFQTLQEYIAVCHYKEYEIRRISTNLGFIIEGCCPGTGADISEDFFRMVKAMDKDMDIVLEQWVPYQGTVEETLTTEKCWAQEGIRIMKQQMRDYHDNY